MRRYSFWMLPVTFASALTIWWTPAPTLQQPVAFETAAEFRAFAQQHGFLIHSGRQKPEVLSNFYITTKQHTWDELGHLSKARCGLTPRWKGVVWVTTHFVSAEREQGLIVDSLGGHHRIWGKVLAAGDEEILDQLEQLYQQ
jgi:hypothetical protein